MAFLCVTGGRVQGGRAASQEAALGRLGVRWHHRGRRQGVQPLISAGRSSICQTTRALNIQQPDNVNTNDFFPNPNPQNKYADTVIRHATHTVHTNTYILNHLIPTTNLHLIAGTITVYRDSCRTWCWSSVVELHSLPPSYSVRTTSCARVCVCVCECLSLTCQCVRVLIARCSHLARLSITPQTNKTETTQNYIFKHNRIETTLIFTYPLPHTSSTQPFYSSTTPIYYYIICNTVQWGIYTKTKK